MGGTPGKRRHDVMRILRRGGVFDVLHAITSECGMPWDTPAERDLWLAEGYVREVGHGGHEFWFGCLYGVWAAQTPDALRRVGCPGIAEICERSFAVLPDGRLPDDPEDLDRIRRAWHDQDPSGARPRLLALDGELYDHPEYAPSTGMFLRFVLANLREFGGNPAKAPTLDMILERDRRLREEVASESAKRQAEEAKRPKPPEVPIPEHDTFRYPWWRSMCRIAAGVACAAAGIGLVAWLGPRDWRVLVAAGVGGWCAVASIREGWRLARFRVTFDPSGVHVTGHASIPWTAVTCERLLSFVGQTGFEVVAEIDGKEQRVRIPGEIARHDRCHRTFCTMTGRHGSPWGLAYMWDDRKPRGGAPSDPDTPPSAV